METHKKQFIEIILNNKKIEGGIIILDFNLYYRAILIK